MPRADWRKLNKRQKTLETSLQLPKSITIFVLGCSSCNDGMVFLIVPLGSFYSVFEYKITTLLILVGHSTFLESWNTNVYLSWAGRQRWFSNVCQRGWTHHHTYTSYISTHPLMQSCSYKEMNVFFDKLSLFCSWFLMYEQRGLCFRLVFSLENSIQIAKSASEPQINTIVIGFSTKLIDQTEINKKKNSHCSCFCWSIDNEILCEKCN